MIGLGFQLMPLCLSLASLCKRSGAEGKDALRSAVSLLRGGRQSSAYGRLPTLLSLDIGGGILLKTESLAAVHSVWSTGGPQFSSASVSSD